MALVGPGMDAVQSAHPLERRGAERGGDTCVSEKHARGDTWHRGVKHTPF